MKKLYLVVAVTVLTLSACSINLSALGGVGGKTVIRNDRGEVTAIVNNKK